MSCRCPEPLASRDPRRSETCNRCGKGIAPISTDESVRAFYDRLQYCLFPGLKPGVKPPRSWRAFREQCEARERAGREKFGLEFHGRNNLREAAEEEADAANYRYFAMLQRFRLMGDDEGVDLALEACRLSYKAYEIDRHLEARWRGEP